MRIAKACLGSVLAAGLIAAGTVLLPGFPAWQGGGLALAQNKAQARQDLHQVITSLQAVDTAYASGNSAEAQTRYDEARASWNKVSPRISAREAREAQLLFDNLGSQLKSQAPATQVRKTVAGIVDELREDIEGELR
jgi:hypothetical protein